MTHSCHYAIIYIKHAIYFDEFAHLNINIIIIIVKKYEGLRCFWEAVVIVPKKGAQSTLNLAESYG